ncbi:MAG: SpoIID/LytB domain-containing protein, partial [Candidatus Omnitrophica bacterium]|nr:SpoIID/LytB domain-containing protein [Candidatus Omnitrophota bacterium]
CGGYTEDASVLWDVDIPPLKGVVCNFCKDSPHFSWQEVISIKEIENKLGKAGREIERIKDITILNRNKSGRVINLKIISLKGDLIISAKDFRNIIGPNLIRSTNFKLFRINNDVVFAGLGWGHGVGLCQWGSYFMAKEGYKYTEILKYYYPQTELSLIPR